MYFDDEPALVVYWFVCFCVRNNITPTLHQTCLMKYITYYWLHFQVTRPPTVVAGTFYYNCNTTKIDATRAHPHSFSLSLSDVLPLVDYRTSYCALHLLIG